MLIALGLFALIGVAGFTLLNSVLRTQDATDTRLGRMAEIQRAMLVVSSDLDQITGSLGGGGSSLSLQKEGRAQSSGAATSLPDMLSAATACVATSSASSTV